MQGIVRILASIGSEVQLHCKVFSRIVKRPNLLYTDSSSYYEENWPRRGKGRSRGALQKTKTMMGTKMGAVCSGHWDVRPRSSSGIKDLCCLALYFPLYTPNDYFSYLKEKMISIFYLVNRYLTDYNSNGFQLIPLNFYIPIFDNNFVSFLVSITLFFLFKERHSFPESLEETQTALTKA